MVSDESHLAALVERRLLALLVVVLDLLAQLAAAVVLQSLLGLPIDSSNSHCATMINGNRCSRQRKLEPKWLQNTHMLRVLIPERQFV